MPKKRFFHYFIEPLDAYSNEVLAKNLSGENAQENILCSDGSRHDVWQCEYRKLVQFRRSESFLKCCFRFWWQENNGSIRPMPRKISSSTKRARHIITATLLKKSL